MSSMLFLCNFILIPISLMHALYIITRLIKVTICSSKDREIHLVLLFYIFVLIPKAYSEIILINGFARKQNLWLCICVGSLASLQL